MDNIPFDMINDNIPYHLSIAGVEVLTDLWWMVVASVDIWGRWQKHCENIVAGLNPFSVFIALGALHLLYRIAQS